MHEIKTFDSVLRLVALRLKQTRQIWLETSVSIA